MANGITLPKMEARYTPVLLEKCTTEAEAKRRESFYQDFYTTEGYTVWGMPRDRW